MERKEPQSPPWEDRNVNNFVQSSGRQKCHRLCGQEWLHREAVHADETDETERPKCTGGET